MLWLILACTLFQWPRTLDSPMVPVLRYVKCHNTLSTQVSDPWWLPITLRTVGWSLRIWDWDQLDSWCVQSSLFNSLLTAVFISGPVVYCCVACTGESLESSSVSELPLLERGCDWSVYGMSEMLVASHRKKLWLILIWEVGNAGCHVQKVTITDLYYGMMELLVASHRKWLWFICIWNV